MHGRQPSQAPTLTDDEIESFIISLAIDHNGRINLAALEEKFLTLDEEQRKEREQHAPAFATKPEGTSVTQRRAFLRFMLGDPEKNSLSSDELKQIIRGWGVPSLKQQKPPASPASNLDWESTTPSFLRRASAWWKVFGPETVFLTLFCGLQIALGVLHALKFALDPMTRVAFGWGVPMSKFCAGAMYPTLFFLLLSMSRWFSTFVRRYRTISRFFMSDYSKTFHIVLACEIMLLATAHAIGHLCGTFVSGQEEYRQWAVNEELHSYHRYLYADFLLSAAGVTGIPALALLFMMSLMSLPVIRRKCYELFQSAHLLMYPFLALLMAHGSGKLLQYPLLGFILAIPTSLVLVERLTRIIRGFQRPIQAQLAIIDKETVSFRCDIPYSRFWPYRAGQYVFLQVPQLSRFQWHPFTISLCTEREMHLHIKTDGNWTGKLRQLALQGGGTTEISVGIDGPYGAPAQRFYDYDQAIIVGAGIGITPFSAIIHDLQIRSDHRWNGKRRIRRRKPKKEGLKPFYLNSSNSSAFFPHTPIDGGGDWDQLHSGLARARLAESLSNLNRIGMRSSPALMTPNNELTAEYTHSPNSGLSCDSGTSTPCSDGIYSLPNSTFVRSYSPSINRSHSQTQLATHPNGSNATFPSWTILSRQPVHIPTGDSLRLDCSNMVRYDEEASQYVRRMGPQSVETFYDDGAVKIDLCTYRRVDMHWIVRDRSHLEWFSDLLNSVSQNSERQRSGHLDMRLYNHVTRSQDCVSTYVFRWLLEQHRIMHTMNKSALTGLVAPTQFGRPDFVQIFDEHYKDMVDLFQAHPERRRRVGVFYCGNPTVGAQLADLCHQLTLRGTQDGSHVKYFFQVEVFS